MTRKLLELVAAPPRVVTVTNPVVAPEGTFTVIVVAPAAIIVAATPLKNFTLSIKRPGKGFGSKPVPEIVIVNPTGPLV